MRRPEVPPLSLLHTIFERKVTLSYVFHGKWYPFKSGYLKLENLL